MLNSLYFANALLFNLCVGFYLILALQWYSYKLKRILFHFHRPILHLIFVFLPFALFLTSLGFSFFSLAFFVLIQIPLLIFWHKKLDKKLVFTPKVKAFFIFIIIFNTIFAILAFNFSFLFNFLTLPFSLIFLKIYELCVSAYYLQKAKNKLKNMPDLKIILITASFGKTSIKHFLFELLKDKFRAQMTPRSVNTLMGIVADINTNLDSNTQIYIAEAGARMRGDILELTRLLAPQICIIGEIGNAHLEYFKSLENTRATKLEALFSTRLEKAFLHSSTLKKTDEKIQIYDELLSGVSADLNGLEFDLALPLKLSENESLDMKEELILNSNTDMILSKKHFKTKLLGAFNAQNLAACIQTSLYLGIDLNELSKALIKLKNVEHRLELISSEPKFIIDDGFNGNLKGMRDSYALCKTYAGRRVLVTPGIIEACEADNIALCEAINDSFDLVIITAKLNAEIFKKELKIESIFLKEKSELVSILAKHTKNKDLILFSNDAPSFM